MLCVQSAVTTPLVRAYDSGAIDTQALSPNGSTLAFGLNVPGGVGHARVLEIIRASGGAALTVTEHDIAQKLARVWRDDRLWISPEGAACLAALPQLLDRGLVRSGERVVAVNTGSAEKYLPNLRHLLVQERGRARCSLANPDRALRRSCTRTWRCFAGSCLAAPYRITSRHASIC